MRQHNRAQASPALRPPPTQVNRRRQPQRSTTASSSRGKPHGAIRRTASTAPPSAHRSRRGWCSLSTRTHCKRTHGFIVGSFVYLLVAVVFSLCREEQLRHCSRPAREERLHLDPTVANAAVQDRSTLPRMTHTFFHKCIEKSRPWM